MPESPFFATFIFHSTDGRFAVPPGAEVATRRVPPKPTNFKSKVPDACGTVVPEDAKDKDLREVLVLNTNLFASFEDWTRFRRSAIGTALWDACDNAVVYRIDATRAAGRARTKGRGVPPKPATAKASSPKAAKKAAKKPAKKSSGKTAKTTKTTSKKVAKKKVMKKSKKPMQTLSRGGVPPKPTD